MGFWMSFRETGTVRICFLGVLSRSFLSFWLTGTVRIFFLGAWNRTFLRFRLTGTVRICFWGFGTVHFQVCVRLDYLFLEMEPYHGLTVYCLYGYFPANELQNRTGLPRWPEQADSAEITYRASGFFKTDTLIRDHAGSFHFRPAGAAAPSEISESV